MKLRAVPMTLAILLGVAGCTGSPQQTDSASEPTQQTRPIRALLDQTSADTQVLMNNASAQVTEECMHKAGFPDFKAPEPMVQANSGSTANEVPGIGLTHLDAASGPVEPGVSGASERSSGPSSAAFTRALFGNDEKIVNVTSSNGTQVGLSTTGCMAEGENAVWGSLEARKQKTTLLMQFNEAMDNAVNTMKNDPEVVAATGRWRDCMAAAGETATDPATASDNPPEGTDLSQWPTAQHDVTCKNESGLTSTAFRAIVAVEQAFLDSNPGAVTEWQSLMGTMKDNANRILTGA